MSGWGCRTVDYQKAKQNGTAGQAIAVHRVVPSISVYAQSYLVLTEPASHRQPAAFPDVISHFSPPNGPSQPFLPLWLFRALRGALPGPLCPGNHEATERLHSFAYVFLKGPPRGETRSFVSPSINVTVTQLLLILLPQRQVDNLFFLQSI